MADSGTPILVTGGCGYVGSHVVLALLDAGFRVCVLDDLSSGLRSILDPRATFYEGGIDNGSLVRGLIQMRDIRAIVHLAGSVDAGDSLNDPMKYYRNNAAASRALTESALTCGVRCLILSSSTEVYGWPAVSPVREDCPPEPRTPYAMSEMMKERMLADSARVYGLNYCTLRYPQVVGGSPTLRSAPASSASTHFLGAVVQAVIGKRAAVRVAGMDFDTRDGSAIREIVHVEDVATAHVAALRKALAEPAWHATLNCGLGRGFSALEVIAAVERVTNLKVPRRERPPLPGQPARLVYDTAEIRAQLGWTPVHTELEELVRDVYRWKMVQLRAA